MPSNRDSSPSHASDLERELRAANRRVEELTREVARHRAELHSVENTLRLANNYLSDLLSAVSDALLVIDQSQVILTANRAALLLLGYEDHELLGEELQVVIPDLPLERALAEASARTAETPSVPAGDSDSSAESRSLDAPATPKPHTGRLRFDTHLCTKDEQRIAVMLAITRLQDGFGDIVYVCAATDMRERLRLESELHHAQRLESLGQLSAGVAHEINNPLGYVIGNLDYLRDELPEDVLTQLPEARDAIEQACEGAMRVREVVGDLLAFARTGDDRLDAIDVTQVLESTLRLATGQIRTRARLTRQITKVPKVLAQRSRLGQVFLNLIMNAVQALRAESSEQNWIHIGTAAAGERVTVEVRDNGPGIPPDVRSRIFEPFFTTKPFGVGTGLGLSICHGIIKRFGGDITLETELGTGTAFFVHLRVAPEA